MAVTRENVTMNKNTCLPLPVKCSSTSSFHGRPQCKIQYVRDGSILEGTKQILGHYFFIEMG
jgi:hypothetical protein